MRKLKLARLLLPIPLWLSGGCDSWMRDIVRDEMDAKIALTSLSVRKVSTRLDQLEGHLAYCSDEVKKLLGKVQQQCQSKDVCTPNDLNIPFEVLRIDPSKQGRFLSLFQERKHLAIYFPEKTRELSDVERKNLRDLIKPAWLDDGDRHTRFLVVSNLEDSSTGSLKRAERRSERVIDTIAEISREMLGLNMLPVGHVGPGGSEPAKPGVRTGVLYAANGAVTLPKERTAEGAVGTALPGPAKAVVKTGRVLNWIFSFSVPGEILRPEDRPVRSDDKLVRSVWVYRIDC